MEQSARTRNANLIFAVAVMLFTGIIFAMHVTNVPLRKVSFVYLVDEAQLWTNFATLIVYIFCGATASKLISRITTPTFRFVLSAVMLLISFAAVLFQIAALPFSPNYFLLYTIYTVFGGLGIGVAYCTVFTTTKTWFPRKIGFFVIIVLVAVVLGLLIVGGLGSLIYLLVNISSIGWVTFYLIFSVIASVFMIIAAAIIGTPGR